MKLVGIGDLYITSRMILDGLTDLAGQGIEIEAIDWPLKDYQELQTYNHQIEASGPEAITLPEALIGRVTQADIIVTHFCPINQSMIHQCSNLKIIGVMRAGVENISLSEAKERNIAVLNTPGRNAHAVSDFTVGLMLAECRNIARAHEALKHGRWRKDFINWDFMPELSDKSVGIIGYGAIGQLVARKLRGFDVKIMVYDPYLNSKRMTRRHEEIFCDLAALLRESDFVTIHARLTNESCGLINRENIRLLKNRAYLINTSRAEIIEEQALREALERRWIAGAALDVFYREPPPPDDWILTLDNVTLTPHMAGTTGDAYRNSVGIIGERLLKYITNRDKTLTAGLQPKEQFKNPLNLLYD